MKKSYRAIKKMISILIILSMSFTAVPVFAETDIMEENIIDGKNRDVSGQCAKAAESLVSGIVFKDIHKSFAAPNLTDERKAKLYEQYKIKLFEIAMDHNMNFELLPMEEFEERDWVTPEKFKEHLEYMANLEFKVNESEWAEEENFTVLWPMRAVNKSVKVISTDGSIAAVIKVRGELQTDLDERAKRQVFSEFNSVTSSMERGMGSWEHLGYERCYADGFRTCMVIIGGTYKSRGVSMQRTAGINFYCRPTGQVA
ncbi:MAG: hypothetical protein HFE90_08540 [Firmicutes bacterium]|nr:hypothetical protein [Bacillota bacterium]